MEEQERQQLIWSLKHLVHDDLTTLILEITGARAHVTETANPTRRVNELIAWAESSAGPGLEAIQRAYQVLLASLLHSAPASEKLAGRPVADTITPPPNNLPRELSSFVGREQEITDVTRLFSAPPLLTLTGEGGIGKTRLALKIATSVLEEHPAGVWLIKLEVVSDPALVPQTIAGVLGLREENGKPMVQMLQEYLKPRRVLLLLDNCEHLLNACAPLANALLEYCPHLKILATSREALHISGEQTYRVPPLSVPPQHAQVTLESLSQFEAAQLFVERATAVQPQFAVTSASAPLVAQVCVRLDGIPLAIELAAARVRAMPVEELNSRLDRCFHLLTGGSRTALSRQQTLKATIDWSYDLLNEQEKALLCRLSVFVGGWTLKAAEFVCAEPQSEAQMEGKRGAGTEGLPLFHSISSLPPDPSSVFPNDVLDLLTLLLDKSLVVYEEREGKARYWLLETVRQYARDRLVESGESDAVRDRHRDHFLAFAEEAEPKLMGPEQVEWFQYLEEEHDNLRAVLDWILNRKDEGGRTKDEETPALHLSSAAGLRLCGALHRFWWTRGHLSEGRQWCERALEMAGDEERTKERGRVLNGTGLLAYFQGDYASARAYYEQSLTIKHEIGDRLGIAHSLNNLGGVACDQGDYASARAYYEESLAIKREIGNGLDIASSLNNLGNTACNQGDYAAAQAYHQESLAIKREIGDKLGISHTLNGLGLVARNQGDYASARTYYEESLAIRSEIMGRQGIAASLNNLGGVAFDQGDYIAAQAYYDQSLAIKHEIGDRQGIAASLSNLGSVAFAQGAYAAARAHFEQSLAISREIGGRGNIAETLEGVAGLAAAEDAWARGAGLLGAAEALREAISSPLPPNERERYDRKVAKVRQVLGEEAFSTAWASGRAMTMEQAIEYALKESGT